LNNSIARFSVNRQPDKVSDRDTHFCGLIRRLAGTVRFAKDEWWAHQGSNLGPDD
jgi:hypothetical protein